MDKTTFDAEVEAGLGGNLVDVEMTSEDYDYVFNKSVRTFKQKGNNNYDLRFVAIPVVTGDRTYDMPTEVDTVVRLIKPKSGFGATDPFSVSVVQQLFSTQGGGGGMLLNYELAEQFLENMNIYMAYETPFVYKKKDSLLELLDVPKTDETWFAECYADLTEEEYRDILWIQEYALAEAKILLGNAYRKFQSLSGPTGETSLAGDQLVQEGKEEKITLLEDISNYVDGDITGAVIFIG